MLDKKLNTGILITILFVLFIGIHYLSQQIPDKYCGEIRNMERVTIACIGIFGAAMLFAKSNGVRSRKLFALLMLMIGGAAIANGLIMSISGNPYIVPKRSLSPGIMTYGSVYGFLFLLYPIEVVRPGWLTLRRVFLLFLPIIFFSGIYYAYSIITKGANLHFSDLSLFERMNNFDFWLRLMICTYPVGCLWMMMRYRTEYKIWMENNYSETKDINIEWLSYYIIGYFLILISYLYTLTIDGQQVIIAHGFIFILFFITLYGKILFHENPYPEGYFKGEKPIEDNLNFISNCINISSDEENIRFADKLSEYKSIFEYWMITEKPYLRKDFKLIDLSEKIPLNRTYLSKLLNDGYHETFSSLIMRYRIAESIRLLNSDNNLSISRISEMSGFSSPSVFGRAFQKFNGTTPSAYRANKGGY